MTPTDAPAATLGDGRYLLRRRIGAGGMGLVYRAEDRRLRRDVAVKLLADNLAADAEARERFLREACAAARLSAPNIVVVHDVGDDESRPYLVMELVDGPSLAEVLATDGPLPPDEVETTAGAVLRALVHAHGAGVVHRDIKPGNLLRTPEGVTKLADFGIAEAGDAPGLTRTGMVLGTRLYLAPERVRGAAANVVTDLWAVGATLAELLTGAPPAGGHAPALPDDTPPRLAALVGWLLADDPSQRPDDAAEALAALGWHDPGAAAGSVPPPAGDPGPTAPPAGRRPVGNRRSRTPGLDPDRGGPAADTTGRATVRWDPAEPAASADPTSADPTSADPTAGSTPGARRTRGSWERTAAVAAAVLVAVLGWQLAVGGLGADGESVVPPGGVEREADDPEGTARNLAEWLREVGGQG